MTAFVVDTNVPVTANGFAEQASRACRDRCVQSLVAAREARIVLDDGGRILKEYMNNLSLSGQPGLGDYFVKWVFENQAVPERCELVALTPRVDTADDFLEFPDDHRLQGFDPSDRKFVAVALASNYNPTILNATDSDWWNFRRVLEELGARVEFLCPELFTD